MAQGCRNLPPVAGLKESLMWGLKAQGTFGLCERKKSTVMCQVKPLGLIRIEKMKIISNINNF